MFASLLFPVIGAIITLAAVYFPARIAWKQKGKIVDLENSVLLAHNAYKLLEQDYAKLKDQMQHRADTPFDAMQRLRDQGKIV